MDTKEATIITAIWIAAVILGFVITYFIIAVIRQYKQVLALTKKSMTAEITAMEKERSRIAAELHDDLGPVLSVVKFQVDHVESADEDDLEQLKKASTHLDDIIQKMRHISANLMPVSLFRKGLAASLEDYFSKIKSATPMAIKYDIPPLPDLNEDQMINTYRIVQEILHNALKHADATLFTIKIHASANNLIIQTIDNGKGFDLHAIQKNPSGIGLASIQNRAQMMGGKIHIESEKAKGTAYHITIPLNHVRSN